MLQLWSNINKTRGKNKLYTLVETFESVAEFDKYWQEMEFFKIYYHHLSHPTTTGSEDVFRCKNTNKRGFDKCETQLLWFIFGHRNESNISTKNTIFVGKTTQLYEGGGKPTFKWRPLSYALSSTFNPFFPIDS